MSAIKNVMKNYARNAELDEFLERELAEAGYGGVDIQRMPIGTLITVSVVRPGLVIGRRGLKIKELTEKMEKKFGLTNSQISVLEVEVPELNPRIMCRRIAQIVARGTAFRRATVWALSAIMNAGALGAEVAISGKLRGERSRYEKYRAGVVPKSGHTADVSVLEATTDVLLKMGLVGIKVRVALRDSVPPEVELTEAGPQEARDVGAANAESKGQ